MRSTAHRSLLRTAIPALVASLALASAPAVAQPKSPPPKPAADSKSPAPAAPAAPPSLTDTLTGAAKASYEGGKLLYVDGDFAGALAKFQYAYDTSNDPRLLWNMAACEKNLRHYGRVLALVGRYQREGGAFLSEQDKQDAAALVATVRTLVSTVELKVAEPGVEIWIDEQRAGTSPLSEPLVLDVGSHRVRASKAGFKDSVQTVQVPGATAMSLEMKLSPADPVAPPVEPVAPRPFGIAPWVLGGSGLAVGIAGAVLLPVGLQAVSASEKVCPLRNQCKSLVAVQQGNTGRVEASVGIGALATAGAAITGALLWQLVFNAPPRKAPAAQLAPVIGSREGGVDLSGVF